ncbi:glycine-rich domain-containing protein [Seonamhaeicola marinus]|uniref:glycine-rich domain-containing protein n=1 Tax=Seonamhaeicola marinus TaxID=1912246 RepID=UPI0016526103|nr:hypothetical protein [Seonamhaeicola marinus]
MIDQHLWNKIRCFKLDNEEASFNFSQRLARDNSWSHDFALNVVEEYKKFIYLCCVSKSPITPSDAVDQVWHLHLTYTKSYWHDFCKGTLNKEIHHNPTKGGRSERKKFSNNYDLSFKMYEQEFGFQPPSNIWKDNKTRFRDINFSRVNLNHYWLVKKPSKARIRISTILSILIIAPFLFIASKNDGGAPIFIILAILALIVILIILTKNGNGNSGCDTGCTFWDSDSDNDSGCDSGCSGCSGCGGCD